jgi:lambda repressor-like predicted transcriptional regulator
MGFIREPDGVDLMVYPSRWTDEDFTYISMVIAHYKKTGKILKTEPIKRGRKKKNALKTVVDTPVQKMPNP